MHSRGRAPSTAALIAVAATLLTACGASDDFDSALEPSATSPSSSATASRTPADLSVADMRAALRGWQAARTGTFSNTVTGFGQNVAAMSGTYDLRTLRSRMTIRQPDQGFSVEIVMDTKATYASFIKNGHASSCWFKMTAAMVDDYTGVVSEGVRFPGQVSVLAGVRDLESIGGGEASATTELVPATYVIAAKLGQVLPASAATERLPITLTFSAGRVSSVKIEGDDILEALADAGIDASPDFPQLDLVGELATVVVYDDFGDDVETTITDNRPVLAPDDPDIDKLCD